MCCLDRVGCFPQDFPSSKHSLCSLWIGWDISLKTFPHQNIPFFLFQEVKADKSWKGLEVPNLHLWSCQYQPPIAQSHQVCLDITLLIGVKRTTSINYENNQYNSLQETLCLKSITLLSMKMKKRRRHISICTGFGSSTWHIFWTGPPYSCSKSDSLFSHFLGFPTLGRAFSALQSLCLWEGDNFPINWINYKVWGQYCTFVTWTCYHIYTFSLSSEVAALFGRKGHEVKDRYFYCRS